MGTLRLGQQGHLLLQIAVPNNIYHYQNDGNIRFVQALRPTLLRRTFEWGLYTDMYLYAYRVIFVHIYVYIYICIYTYILRYKYKYIYIYIQAICSMFWLVRVMQAQSPPYKS